MGLCRQDSSSSHPRLTEGSPGVKVSVFKSRSIGGYDGHSQETYKGNKGRYQMKKNTCSYILPNTSKRYLKLERIGLINSHKQRCYQVSLSGLS